MRPTVKTAVLGALGLAVIVLCCALSFRLTWIEGAAPAKVITVYAWEDYLSREILDEFTSTTGIAVRVVTFGTIDESLATLETKANDFDLALVDEVSLEPLSSSKLIRPFNDKLMSDVAARSKFADPLGMGIPYLWGCTGLAFDKRRVPEATQSISVLWDPRWRGRVAVLEDMF
ncbi:MAG: extracellular solute-binding protein, partial [Myxococcota bacterium]|nr:extracellular solute-binding protein [Myxococcota bacterium]